MNNELFDSLLRNHLTHQAVQPSSGVRKGLFKKMFFYNIWVFHKVKAALILLTLSSSSLAFMLHKKSQLLDVGGEGLKGAVALHFSTEMDLANYVNGVEKQTEENVLLVKEEEWLNEKSDDSPVVIEGVDIAVMSNEMGGSKKEKSKEGKVMASSSIVTLEESVEGLDFQLHDALDKIAITVPSIAVSLVDFVPDTNFNLVAIQQIKQKPIVFKEISFDGLASFRQTGMVSNELTNPFYNEYYWDFYADQEIIELPRVYGLQANYRVGTYRHKWVVSGGVSTLHLHETNTQYQHNEITNQAWLNYFDVSEISWVNTYGQDTCINCFYAQSSDELRAEIENGRNQYSYVNIPLMTGYQLNLGRLSVELKGGLQSSILTNAKGLYVKQNDQIEGSDLYYWSDLEMTTLSRENELLKPVHFSLLANAQFRVRLSSHFDLMAGYSHFQSMGNFTQDNHLLNKSYAGQQLTMGISFYPNRLPLLKAKHQF
jgi:hypothetical protein